MDAPDPMIVAARDILATALADLRASVEGTQPDRLDWKPAGDDSNSITVLAVHSLHSTRSWLSVAIGADLPERDRPAEFRARASARQDLLALVDTMSHDCLALLDGARGVDWAAARQTHARMSGGAEQVSAAWALLHALEHLREHVGQMQLTRQLA